MKIKLKEIDVLEWQAATPVNESAVRNLVGIPDSECRYGEFRVSPEGMLFWEESGLCNCSLILRWEEDGSWLGGDWKPITISTSALAEAEAKAKAEAREAEAKATKESAALAAINAAIVAGEMTAPEDEAECGLDDLPPQVINLTPHEVVVRPPVGADLRFPASGEVARVAMQETEAGQIAGLLIPTITRQAGEIIGLPAPKPGTIYLVSAMVLDAIRDSGRTDIYAPDTGATAIRDNKGRIVAVTRLVALD